jgi:hypothetical protein
MNDERRMDVRGSISRLGVFSGVAVSALSVAYVVVLSVGLLTLPSPDQQIQDPWFTLMELLILAIAPAMVAFAVAMHSWVPAGRRALSLLSVTFMVMCAVVTCAVHFLVLSVSRDPVFASTEWSRLVFSFTWPSIAYALDVLAWDVFFPLGALFAALCVRGTPLAGGVQALFYSSSAFSFLGLLGVPLANMQIRNLGIIGYAVLFPVATAISAMRFRTERFDVRAI